MTTTKGDPVRNTVLSSPRFRRLSRPAAATLLVAAATFTACARNPDAIHWRHREIPLPPPALSPAWEQALPFCPESVTASPQGTLRLAGGGRVLEVDPADGSPREDAGLRPLPAPAGAEAIAPGLPDGPPQIERILWEDRALLVESEAGTIHAARADTGKSLWTVQVAAAIVATAQIYRDRVILQSLDNYVYCLRTKNGHEVWRARLSHRLVHPAAFWKDRLLVIPQGSPTLWALDLLDGSDAGSWTLSAPGRRFVTGPAVAGGRVAAAHAAWGGADCVLVALELAAPADQ